MRKLRSLLAASMLSLVAALLPWVTAKDASAAPAAPAAPSLPRFAPHDAAGYVIYKYYSDASLTTQVGEIHFNWHCIQGYNPRSGTVTSYYTAQLISYC